jgi:hypothetical protein
MRSDKLLGGCGLVGKGKRGFPGLAILLILLPLALASFKRFSYSGRS